MQMHIVAWGRVRDSRSRIQSVLTERKVFQEFLHFYFIESKKASTE